MFQSPPAFAHSLDGAVPGSSTWSWEVPTGHVSWSAGIEALFGLPDGGFDGTFEAYLALIHPEDRAYFQAVIARTIAGEDDYVMSHRVSWPDGSVHWIDGRGHLERDGEGRPLRLSGIVWTAEARKLADAKVTHLRRVEAVAAAVRKELLRVRDESTAFAHACRIAVEHGHFHAAWIGLVDANGQVKVVARAGALDGYLDEAAIASDLSLGGRGPVGLSLRGGEAVVINDVERDEVFVPWREPALRRGLRGCGALPLRRAGRVVGVMVIYAAEENRFDIDQVRLFSGLADDIGFELDAIDETERRRAAEQALRESEERYRALVEQASDAIFLLDPQGTFVEVNAATCTMTGFARDEIIGRGIGALFESSAQAAGPLVLRAAQDGVAPLDRRLVRKDGDFVDIEISAVELADGRVQAYARDVTARKVVQQRLIVADRLASLGRLAAGVAHEINNPLTYISLSLERIERCADGDDGAELGHIRSAATDARDGVDRVRGIVRSLGTLSRQEDGPVGAVDLRSIVEGAVRLAENRLRHRARVVAQFESSRLVRGSELRLGQVFVNLVVNAADAFEEARFEKNELLVRTRDEGDHVVVIVRDNGVGIAPENLGRIFDPFFTTKPVGEGTGLGLAICHAIVSAFDGRIDVDSRPGEGTTFRVSLPAEVRTRSSERRVSPRCARARRILVVDDEPRLAARLAASLAHHDVTVAASGEEALEILSRGNYECILCDLMMPGVSGIALHAALVRAGRGQERRMILMTGGAFDAEAKAFVARGVVPILDKPFSVEECELAIAALCEREESSSGIVAS